MDINQQVIFILILLLAGAAITVVVWFRAYKHNMYIEKTGLDYDGRIYNTPND